MTRQQMHKVLEDMLGSAKVRNKEEVLRLNTEYEDLSLSLKVYGPQLTQADLLCENCRLNCIKAVLDPDMHDTYISEAEQNLSALSKLNS